MIISVVVPTFGRPANLLRCLGGLARQTRPPDQVLLAVREDDQATRAALSAFAGELPLKTVLVGRADASEARNRCLIRAVGEILVMTDDDTVARPDWLATIHDRFLRDPRLGALGGPDWTGGEEVPAALRPSVVGKVQWWGRRIGNHHRGARRAIQVEWLKGANMSFRRAALTGIGFGRMLRGGGAQFGEDVAVSLEVKRGGWKVGYDPTVVVDHFPGPLRGMSDHRRLADPESLADASHNDTVILLEYLPPGRRLAFMAWALLVGTRLLPGALMVVYLTLTRGDPLAAARFAIVRRGRIDGWRRWRDERDNVRLVAGIARPTAPVRALVAVDRPSVCLVTHVVAPWDGQGRVVHRLARYLIYQGIDVTLVASEVDPALLDEAGLRWLRVPVWHRFPQVLRWLIFAAIAPIRLRPALRSRFDVVHLNGAIAPIPADVNTAHFVHRAWGLANETIPGGPRLGLYQRLVTTVCAAAEARAFRVASIVVAVSEAVRQSLIAGVGLDPDAIRVVHNGVDPAEFRPRAVGEPRVLRRHLGLSDDEFLILFVGDAKSPRKNLDLALQTLSRLPRRFSLAVIGAFRGGPYPAMATRLGVGWRTYFLGVRRDVAACLRDADLVICASRYEPASLVLLEAMASGVPAISSPQVGNAVFIEQGRNGFVLRSTGDVAGAEAVIRSLSRDRDLAARVGRAARETAIGLSWDRMGEQYESIYRSLIAERSNPRRITPDELCEPVGLAMKEQA